MKQYLITLTFTEPLLGTAPLDKEVYTNYIADKKAEMTADELDDEVDSLREEKGVTGFHREGDSPFLYDYMLRGFMKDACGMLRRSGDTLSKKLPAYKRVIDGLVFVEERRIFLDLPACIGMLERPIRVTGPQGERVALVKSEMAPIGTRATFTLTVFDNKAVSKKLLTEWFDYGRYRGMGQWRNGSYGQFSYEMTEA